MTLADLEGEEGGQILSFDCSFRQKKNRLAHPLWEFVPPQENPGSATDHFKGISKALQLYFRIFTNVHEDAEKKDDEVVYLADTRDLRSDC